jgi:RNA polymerase sigma-70 factor, ECF subfamily
MRPVAIEPEFTSMTAHMNQTRRELAAARAGSNEALGRLLEAHRTYLLLVAGRELDSELRAKGGASDLVQETFMEAQRDLWRFQGSTEQEFRAWLRQLLRHNLSNFARRYRDTVKRRLVREVSLNGDDSRVPLANLIADGPRPQERALSDERAFLVRNAVDRLPEEYRQVLLLRCRDGCSFDEIGGLMRRTANAAQKLWVRALERLQRELGGPCER